MYVTLEDQNSRHIARDYQVEQPGSDGKILLPLALCRECGQEYLVAWRRQRPGAAHYLARQGALAAGGEGAVDSDGYLYTCRGQAVAAGRAGIIADRSLPERAHSTCRRR